MGELEFRRLKVNEIDREYLDILSQLASGDLSDITVEQAREVHIDQLEGGRTSFILKDGKELVGIASVIYDFRIPNYPKFAAHVEDVAIKKDKHGMGYGKVLMKFLVDEVREQGAYKVILSCSDHNIKFYKKCGFIHTCATMRLDFDEDYN